MPKLVNNSRRRWPDLVVIGFFSFWLAYFAWFWARSVTLTETGDLMLNHVNMWGDWAAHFTMGSAMGYRELLLTQSPFLIGAKFSYPFLANLISAFLIKLGVPFFSAFIVPSFIASIALVFALYYFFKTLLSNKVLAVVASLIVLLNGGLGFYYYFQDVRSSDQPIQTILNPPHEYTRLDKENIKWISIIDSMIIPQRAFTHGFPVALFALALVHQVTFQKTQRSQLKLMIAGLLLGLLPLIHTHSFLAAGIILSGWLVGSLVQKPLTAMRRRRLATTWGLVGGISLLIAGPLCYFFFFNQTQGFFKWHPGWLASDFQMNWLWFWFKNWLFTPLLGFAGLILLIRRSIGHQTWAHFFIWSPFIMLFILANLFLFQPFAWDNTKLIVWSSIGVAGLSAVFLQELFLTKKKALIGLAIIVFVSTIATGSLDTYWVIRTDLHSFRMYSAEELELAEWVIDNTPADARWLTSDRHNHWLFNLTGRQTVMAYRGWLWTHGYNYLPIDADVGTMFSSPTRSDLYSKYNVEYVVIGPDEKRNRSANGNLFRRYFELIKTTDNYQLFQRKQNN